ncbi:TatD family hydrolase [Halobacteriovorax sp. JY17]|uniref:TatD family hydrolase n=1 Tax=Halobacteriovorax sp. JY17 TaxID=2014617 RepID=UPI000C483669|nr:TatD family hydrolase [Halobacteriovorax sp. JY17]PIK13820.1 MAG: hydrolase TatD [Halobacteriovorax sp. JY17]
MSKKRREIPIFKLPIIETHCHLDYLKEEELSELLSKSLAHGIEKIMTISVSPNNLQTVVDIANNHDNIFCTQGIHPHDAKEWSNEAEKIIRSNLGNQKVKAVGEIGLDFHYNKSGTKEQIEVFKKQLEIAIEFEKPVVIHTRDADKETMEILKEYAPRMKRKGVIHSFTSTKELALCALDLGFHLGFNGIITFKNAEDVRDTLRVCPIERILLETDAPFLTPIPYRGRENAPYYLPFIAEKVAEIKEVELETVLKTCYQNSKDCLSL